MAQHLVSMRRPVLTVDIADQQRIGGIRFRDAPETSSSAMLANVARKSCPCTAVLALALIQASVFRASDAAFAAFRKTGALAGALVIRIVRERAEAIACVNERARDRLTEAEWNHLLRLDFNRWRLFSRSLGDQERIPASRLKQATGTVSGKLPYRGGNMTLRVPGPLLLEALTEDKSLPRIYGSERADLVVIGRCGRSRFGRLLVGRTTERLLRTCRRPVLVVRRPVEQSYRQLLVPIDFTASSDAALRVAAQMRQEARMQVFHAISSRRDAALRDADVPERIIRQTRLMEEAGTNARMRRQVAGLGLDCTPMNFALACGSAVGSTLRHARQLEADLVVAGKQGRSTLGGFLLGSVSSGVLAESTCDMLIVPRPRDSSPLHAATTAMPREAHPDYAARAQSADARAGALTQGHWIHNTARFMPRRTS